MGKRRIVVFNRITVDGCFAGADGGLDFVVPEPKLDKSVAKALDRPGTILFGRRTYELFASFWPQVTSDSPEAANPHDPRGASKEMRAMGDWLNASEKLVFSRTLKEAGWRNSRVLPAIDAKAIRALQRRKGSDLFVFGSGSVVTQLTGLGLVDEYQLVLTPALLGGGRPLFGDLARGVRLALLEARPFPAGNVLLRYGVA